MEYRKAIEEEFNLLILVHFFERDTMRIIEESIEIDCCAKICCIMCIIYL